MRLVGAPIMWPADNLPLNTLVLDGSLCEIALYSQLYSVYGRIYTPVDVDSLHFCLPDYRGRVLRGVDMGAGHDVNPDSRVRIDGVSGDVIGSYQSDDNRRHSHKGEKASSATGQTGNTFTTAASFNGAGIHGGLSRQWTTWTGADETRCDNIAMTYITYYQ